MKLRTEKIGVVLATEGGKKRRKKNSPKKQVPFGAALYPTSRQADDIDLISDFLDTVGFISWNPTSVGLGSAGSDRVPCLLIDFREEEFIPGRFAGTPDEAYPDLLRMFLERHDVSSSYVDFDLRLGIAGILITLGKFDPDVEKRIVEELLELGFEVVEEDE